ncbi:tRNA modification GTPase MnmE [Desulfosarcina cetonica]|uniref:tRNA uridine-5-carboxymethylaminomethyl(34) synthesis GTPase MnmE n=1 Tax=Desulfosarcina cetonica TaxID=90730 RepID=UPI0006D237AE|nr:tRNA uridine-5-carboxymethylaminomethyl(34) synthesis GTPase MnmE [Desulfosarcina cetonica]VTR69040.1 tRNA modification GTPase MnmE [Desulfosarcina cetonica]
MLEETIAAIATALGPAGIGIIRISGPNALEIIYKLFSPIAKEIKNSNFLTFKNNIKSHRIYFGRIQNYATNEILDEAIILYMKGPKSFTREDVVEIQVHSGIINLERILKEVIKAGARIAEPGEFTLRAFNNGRIDLTQAESIIDLINAPCEKAAQIAIGQLSGILSKKIEKLRNCIYDIKAKLEAYIEFYDDENIAAEKICFEAKKNLAENILPEIKKILKNSNEKSIYAKGIILTIAGYPNVGKSSLLNCLVEKETAIVSEIPGTTRDIVKDFLTIKGLPITACDTAGIHHSIDPIELKGIKKTKENIECSDIIIFILDGSRILNKVEKEFLYKNNDRNLLKVINKIDISTEKNIANLEKYLNENNIPQISAKNDIGIEKLKNLIFEKITHQKQTRINFDFEVANLRQCYLLEKIEKEINRIFEKEIFIDLQDFSDAIGIIINIFNKITGNVNSDKLYKQIFQQFCIGK